MTWREHLAKEPERLADIYYADSPISGKALKVLFMSLHRDGYGEDADRLVAFYLDRLDTLMERLDGNHPVVAALTAYCIERGGGE
jgi:hypothetical protein